MNEFSSKSVNHLPLLSNQKRLWILSQQDPENPAYNLQLTYHIKSDVDYDTLNESIQLLFNKQPFIFSVFKQTEGIPYIEIVPRIINVEIVDFSHLPEETRREKIISFAGIKSRESFNIEKGPLYRFFLLKEDNESFFFQAIIHHLVFDGWSMRIFVQELSRMYTNLSRGVIKDPKPFNYQSIDFEKLDEASRSEEDEKLLIEFWKENLSGCPSELKFPYDYPREKRMTGLGHKEPVSISKESTL